MRISKAVEFALSSFKKYGLDKWTLILDVSTGVAGYCYHNRKQIALSRNWILYCKEEEVKDTILHEIAHALLPVGEGHSMKWKRLAKEIGARPMAKVSKETTWKVYKLINKNYGKRTRRKKGV